MEPDWLYSFEKPTISFTASKRFGNKNQSCETFFQLTPHFPWVNFSTFLCFNRCSKSPGFSLSLPNGESLGGSNMQGRAALHGFWALRLWFFCSSFAGFSEKTEKTPELILGKNPFLWCKGFDMYTVYCISATSGGISSIILPETNSQFAPEN